MHVPFMDPAGGKAVRKALLAGLAVVLYAAYAAAGGLMAACGSPPRDLTLAR